MIDGVTPSDIMSGLAEQRDTGVLCDVKLKVGEKFIPAHRSVLAAASPFFRGMFTLEFKEKTDHIVKISDVTFDAVNAVIEAVYKHKLVLTSELVPEVLHVSHMLQMNGIADKCKAYMIYNLSLQTCFNFLGLSEKYDLKDLIDEANGFVLKKFVDISQSPEFVNISKEALCGYLSSDTLNFNRDEMETFEAAQRWLEAGEDRIQFAGEVMNNVRFKLMDPKKLARISENRIVLNNSQCQKLIMDALVYQAIIYEQPLDTTDQNKPRGKPAVLTIEGTGCRSGQTYIYHGSGVLSDTTVDKGFLPETLSAVQMNNFVYMFGADDRTHLSVAVRYNVSTDKCLELKALPETATVGATCTLVNKNIYLIGGMFVNAKFVSDLTFHAEHMSSITYSYSIPTNKWRKLENLTQCLAKLASCSVGNVVHVTGGLTPTRNDNLQATDRHYAYDIAASVWLTKPRMRYARCGHVMESVESALYVFGGEESDDNVQVVESYGVSSEQWTVIQTAKFDGSCCASFVAVDGIYITGGHHRKDDSEYYHYVDKIYKYDVGSQTIAEQDMFLRYAENNHFSAMMISPELL